MKKARRGQCVHCLEEPVELTNDHVLPLSWYPDSTPENLEKWTIPACAACNNSLGTVEEDLLLRFGLCIDPAEALAAGISEKALRSIKPECARDENDRRLRQARRDKVLSELIHLDSPPTTGVLPNFGPQPHLTYGRYSIVLIPQEELVSLGNKLVRGITYLVEGAYINHSYRIEVFFVEEGSVPEVQEILSRHGQLEHRGPGFVV